MMKRKFVCRKEMPLSEQVDVNEQTEISEIVVSGYLGGKDLMLLSNMSQGGNLLILDMSGVTELDTDGMDGTIESTPFCDDNGLEEVYLPNIDKLIYPMFYNCTNLKRVDGQHFYFCAGQHTHLQPESNLSLYLLNFRFHILILSHPSIERLPVALLFFLYL